MTVHEEHTKLSDSMSEKLVATMMNKILLCEKRSGRRFSAKLVGFENGKLFFESRDGSLNWDLIEDIKSAIILPPKKVD